MDDHILETSAPQAESGWHGFWRRVMAPPLQPEDMTPAQRRYDAFAAFPMFLASIVWMLSAFFTWVPTIHDAYGRTGFHLSVVTWCIFLLDMVIRFVLDPSKSDFFRRNWPLLVALAFPPLRVLLVGSAVLRIRRDRNALAKMVGLYAIYAVAFVVVFGAALTLSFEIDASGSTIRSFGDAVWWGFETVTTVGYGDFTPVTVPGRGVAVLIMFTGAAAVGAVTAAVASRFISGGSSASGTAPASPAAPAGDGATVDELSRQMAALQEQIELIAEKLGVRAADSQGG